MLQDNNKAHKVKYFVSMGYVIKNKKLMYRDLSGQLSKSLNLNQLNLCYI